MNLSANLWPIKYITNSLFIIKSMLNLYAYTYMLKKVLHYMYLLHFTLKKMEIIILDLAQFSFIPWL